MLSDDIARLHGVLFSAIQERVLTAVEMALTIDQLADFARRAEALEQNGGPIPRLTAATIDDAVIARAGGKVVRLRPRDVTPPPSTGSGGDRA